MDKKEIVEFKINRFDPDQNKKYVSSYKVPILTGMTILDALNYIKEKIDGSLTFRHSCRMGICGSCGVVVNGKSMLACHTQVLQLKAEILEIDPIPNLPIIKDLVVDFDPFFRKFVKINPILIKSKEELSKPTEFIQKPNELKKYWNEAICVKCSLCYGSCPAAIDPDFLGPSSLTSNYRFIADSRDKGLDKRLKTASETIWLCTSCKSCSISCPKEIDCATALDNERSCIVEESDALPRTTIDIFDSVFKYHNPLRLSSGKRMNWSDGLDIKQLQNVEKTDILCFIGCLPSYDARNQEIAKSAAQFFTKAGADFATLGSQEWCCGDHILRLGEKGLFEDLAAHNISQFKKYNYSKIVTLSPHCFHTFKNDEPYASLNLNVQHFTEFAAEELKTGKIEITKKINKKITYHDPCFLGKRNEIYDPPRQILESIPGLEFVEMKRRKENSFCCGGGAGRTWTDDTKPENRPAVNRINEAMDLGAEIIVTACPFCISTLEDAIKVLDIEEKIEVKDISEILRETT